VNLDKFVNTPARPRTKAVPVPELADWGLFEDGEPLVWTVRSLTALEFYRCAQAQNEAIQRLHQAISTALAGSEDSVAKLREVAEQTPGEFSKKIEMLCAASVSPAISPEYREVVVKLSEQHPAVFFRLVSEVEMLFVQGGELGKPKPSGETNG
jgi:hypothetical protein